MSGKAIILEGPDGGGKSTLAKYISSQLGYTYVHTAAPSQAAMSHYLQPVYDNYDNKAVYDRLHIGNVIYGTVYRGGPDLTPLDIWRLEGYLTNLDAVVIYCRPPDEFLDASLDSRYKDIYEEDPWRVSAVREFYDWYMNNNISELPIWTYDYHSSGLDDILDGIKNLHSNSVDPLIKDSKFMIGSNSFPNAVITYPVVTTDYELKYLMQSFKMAKLSLTEYVVIERSNLTPEDRLRCITSVGHVADIKDPKHDISHFMQYHYLDQAEYAILLMLGREHKCALT